MRRRLIPFLVILIGTATLWQGQAESGLPATVQGQAKIQARGYLPAEAWEPLELIEGGSEFQNRKDHVPAATRGYYREYTVPMPVEKSAP
jgi:guanyl-specific ribonuclease Sa